MTSPFPGMDPYLEDPSLWPDVHQSLSGEIRDRLIPELRPRYVARLVPRQVMDEPGEEELRVMFPDISVIRRPAVEPQPAPAATATISAPVTVANVMRVPFRQVGIEIRETRTGVLVTAIELLSPANKRPSSEGRQSYLRKREMLLGSTAHLLEIDLIRRGEPLPLDPSPPNAPYYVILSRANQRPDAEVWPVQLHDPLPTAPVPLLEPDPDVSIDLGAALHAVYGRAGYDLDIDYTGDTFPPLEGETAAWAEKRLKDADLR